jgi:endonuclease/exonuclease/phosphatase family metal-dependent hydrolase
VVALQEIDPRMHGLVSQLRETVCHGDYREAWVDDPASDRELVLTTLPIVDVERIQLAGPLRTALWARLRSRLGTVDLVVTHTGAGSDTQGRGGALCTRLLCKPPCQTGESMVTCQIGQARDYLMAKHAPAAIALLVGDLNVAPGSPPYRLLTDAGLVDTHLAAGNAECDPATSRGCTGGRIDTSTDVLRDPVSHETERIDYAWLLAPKGCSTQLDNGDDRDADGVPTGLFADEPVTPGPSGLVWPSDHVGVAVDLAC